MYLLRGGVRVIIHPSIILLDIRHSYLLPCSICYGLDLGKLAFMIVEALLVDHSAHLMHSRLIIMKLESPH